MIDFDRWRQAGARLEGHSDLRCRSRCPKVKAVSAVLNGPVSPRCVTAVESGWIWRPC
jgi:hypothetical protein